MARSGRCCRDTPPCAAALALAIWAWAPPAKRDILSASLVAFQKQDKLTPENTEAAERAAGQQAANPLLMNLARSAAKDAVRQNLAIPLQVAGFGDVTVDVMFDGEQPAR